MVEFLSSLAFLPCPVYSTLLHLLHSVHINSFPNCYIVLLLLCTLSLLSSMPLFSWSAWQICFFPLLISIWRVCLSNATFLFRSTFKSCSCCCSVAQSCLTLWPHGLQRARLLCPPLSPGVCANSCPLSQWCYLTISPSAAPFSFYFNLSRHQSFPVSWLFVSGGQSIGASAIALPMNVQDWFPSGLTDLISLQSRELSRVFSSTTIWKHQFFGTQPSLWSNSHICAWLLDHSFDYMDLYWQRDVSVFNTVSMFVIAFLPRSKRLLTWWLQPVSTVILEFKTLKSVAAFTFYPSVCHEVMEPDDMMFVFWMLSFFFFLCCLLKTF